MLVEKNIRSLLHFLNQFIIENHIDSSWITSNFKLIIDQWSTLKLGRQPTGIFLVGCLFGVLY